MWLTSFAAMSVDSAVKVCEVLLSKQTASTAPLSGMTNVPSVHACAQCRRVHLVRQYLPFKLSMTPCLV